MALNKEDIKKTLENVNPLFRDLYYMYIEDLEKMNKSVKYNNEQIQSATSKQSITKVMKNNTGGSKWKIKNPSK